MQTWATLFTCKAVVGAMIIVSYQSSPSGALRTWEGLTSWFEEVSKVPVTCWECCEASSQKAEQLCCCSNWKQAWQSWHTLSCGFIYPGCYTWFWIIPCKGFAFQWIDAAMATGILTDFLNTPWGFPHNFQLALSDGGNQITVVGYDWLSQNQNYSHAFEVTYS